MLIALHLGAHKTATTYIQDALQLSREELNQDGICFVPLRELRKNITERLDFGRRGLDEGTDRILEEYGSCSRLIFSDENIIGSLKPSFGSGFYPWRRMRLGKLFRKLRGHERKIYFATRSYDEFISSIYCEYLRHNPFVPVRAYLRGVNLEAFSWTKVVATFVRLIGAENVTVWRYEDFHLLEEQVFSVLIDRQAGLLHKPTGLVRESLSSMAVQTLASLPPLQGADKLRARAAAAAAAHPKAPGNPSFSAFEPATADALRARYEHEISRLPEEFPGIQFLGAPAKLPVDGARSN